jgi:hypothetical protein
MTKPHYRETDYGFDYGAARVSRVCHDDTRGWVIVQVQTPRDRIHIYVTKTGKARVHNGTGLELLATAREIERLRGLLSECLTKLEACGHVPPPKSPTDLLRRIRAEFSAELPRNGERVR